MANNPDKSKKKIIIIVASAIIILSLLVGGIVVVQKLGQKETSDITQEEVYEPNYVTDEEFNDILDSINSQDEPVVVEEFENGDRVVMDATGETYIEPEYSPDLVEAAHQWASKVDRKFADDNDMVHGFMADDAYITYIIYGTLNPDEEPVQQQPQQQPQQKPQQQPGNQGKQQQQQPSDGGSIEDARDFFGQDGVGVSTGADAGEIGDWELPGNVHVE